MREFHPRRLAIVLRFWAKHLVLGERPLVLLGCLAVLFAIQPLWMLGALSAVGLATATGMMWFWSSRQRRIDATAVDWFARFHEGSLDSFNWQAFEAWLLADSRHRAAYDAVEALWYAMDEVVLAEGAAATDVSEPRDSKAGAEVINLQQRRLERQRVAEGLRHFG